MEKKQTPVMLVEQPTTFKLNIPESVESKIRHICTRIHEVEWSGILFYTASGSFEDGTAEFTCLDICVMDIGTSGFTDFKDTEDIIGYRVDHPELLQPGVYEGLVHSHNNMAAFFSGTDSNTLQEEGLSLNHFLSLIVNNAGKYVAKVTRKVVKKVEKKAHIVSTESSFYNTFENKKITLAQDKVTEEDKECSKEEVVIEHYNLVINKAEINNRFEELDSRLTELKTKKESKIPTYFGTSLFSKSEEKIPDYKKSPYYSNFFDFKPQTATETGYSIRENRDINNNNINSNKIVKDKKEEADIALYETEHASPDIIKDLCTKALCGSILISKDANIDLEKFAYKLDISYTKVFGNLDIDANRKEVSYWVQLIVNFLFDDAFEKDEVLCNRIANKYIGYSEEDINLIIVNDALSFLRTLPDSIVLGMIKEALEDYFY